MIVLPIAFAVAANACYTGGWVLELTLRKLWPIQSRVFGPMAFVTGMIFSAAVALLPALLAVSYLLYISAHS